MLTRILTTSLIAASIIAAHAANADPQPVKTDGTVITSVDVEDLLTRSLGLNRARRVAEDDACPGGGGGGGMRAKRWCYWDIEFRDLAVDKILDIKIGEVELSKIPSFYKFEHVGHENCWSTSYPFDEDVTYKSSQVVTVALTEVLTKVKDYSDQVGVNANLLTYIGVKEDTKIGTSIRYEVTKASTKSLQNEFELRQHIKYDIPAMTARWAYYSDEKKDVKVPITITGVIGGRVVDHSSYGSNYDRDVFKLTDKPESLRTFTIHGSIEFLGSNRSVDVKLREKALSASDCAASPPAGASER
ncbi:MAG TPA: hypothetical protein VMA53_05095 [Stellaceae bacterium]|nr:hypothetical protein [Stellaceae bacterium]